ncbi:27 kDa hemolymph protein-like [Periplaneta americana]|uniref:27 kDa hemolymph protein-like n=1 Tax=Periplaneta americana TaxID=6978 RepID=UPI0037E93AC8
MYSITTRWSVISALVLIGGMAFAEIDTSTRFPNLQDLNFGNLPGNVTLPGNLPINISHVPSIEEGEKLFEEKCKKMGHPEAYQAAQAAKDEVQECVKSLVNVTVLQAEVEAAKPTGDLDVVFRKYCRQSPQLQYCITNFTASIEPCLDEKEKENKNLIQNITDSIVKFICYKEGDRIALFIAEGGPECLTANQEAIQSCVNRTIMKNLPKDTLSIDNMPSLVLGEEQCRDIDVLQKCVVKSLEGCSEPTPANIVDSMFNFVRKMTPCAKISSKAAGVVSDDGSGSASNTAAIVTVIALLFMTVFAR